MNMTNQFARFVHTTPLSSIPHDPPISLASNCIRDFFGPSVQLVADCLQARGGSSKLSQIIATINSKSQTKKRTKERKEIIKASKLRPAASTGSARTSSIRAALLVLIHHSIVSVTESTNTHGSKKRTVYHYKFDADRARLLQRYPRFVEYTKKALDIKAAALIEELLFQGRMRTVEAIVSTVEQLDLKDAPRSDKYTDREAVLESFRRLVQGGYIQEVKEIIDPIQLAEMDGDSPPPAKKRRLVSDDIEDPAVVELLQTGPYKILPRDAVWRVNVRMFHDILRASSLGYLVSERYGHRVQFAGSIITAALRLAAYKEHAEQDVDFESQTLFTPNCITRYLPKSVLQTLEKKPGGILPNLHNALKDLARFSMPPVVEEMEVADGYPGDAKFKIATRQLVQYLQDRITHQVGIYNPQKGPLCFISTNIFSKKIRLFLIVTGRLRLESVLS